MLSWKAIGYGLLVFPFIVIMALYESPPWILVAGFPSGFVAGYWSKGPLKGLLHGIFTGCGIAFLFLGGVLYIIRTAGPSRTYPGVGLAITLVILIALLLAVESIVAGAIGGIVNR